MRERLLNSYKLDGLLPKEFNRRQREDLIDFFMLELESVINKESYDQGVIDGHDDCEEVDEDAIFDSGYDEGFEAGKISVLKSDLDRAKEAYYGASADEVGRIRKRDRQTL